MGLNKLLSLRYTGHLSMKRGRMFASLVRFFTSSMTTNTLLPTTKDLSPEFHTWVQHKPSMKTLFQNETWGDWVMVKKPFVSIHLFTHLDIPEIQNDYTRKTNSFARSLFYTHGMLIFERSLMPSIPTVDVQKWMHRKLYPYHFIQQNKWRVSIRDSGLINKPFKYVQTPDIYELPSSWSSIQVAQHLTTLNLENVSHYPVNYTMEPILDLWVSSHHLALPPPDTGRKYYVVIDVGTSKCTGPVQPENVRLKDAAWILFDDSGKEVLRQTVKFSLQYPLSSYLFFIHLASVLFHFKAEIVAYNGAFDAVVLSRWPFNPVVSQILSVWNYDVMYMAMTFLHQDKVCSLGNTFKKILGKDFEKEWHVSINDCEGTQRLFLHLMKSLI